MNDDEVTITVSRDDLDEVLYRAPTDYRNQARQRIADAIPPRPWEPSEEQIAAYERAWSAPNRPGAFTIEWLKKLHAAGLVLP